MILNPRMPCPACRAVVPNRKPIGRPYECTNCHTLLQPRMRQAQIEGWGFVAVAFIAAWLLGYRGWELVGIGAVFFVVLELALTPILGRIWPMELERYDGRSPL